MNGTCSEQEIQRFDPPSAQVKCEVMLPIYREVPLTEDYPTATAEYICKPVGSLGT
jgi:hypothetical protein